jgi:hypothetical protein
MQLSKSLVTVLVGLASACAAPLTAPSPSPIVISVPSTVQVAPTGSTVQYSLTNVSSSTVMITMCGDVVASGTELRVAGRWDEDTRRGPACTTDRYNGVLPLEPGETWTGATSVVDLGTLRVVLVADGVLRASTAISATPGPA